MSSARDGTSSISPSGLRAIGTPEPPLATLGRWYQIGIKRPRTHDRRLALATVIRLTYAEKRRADERTRTADLLITSELLYQLSYVGLLRFVSIS